jgi:hypothetical protein
MASAAAIISDPGPGSASIATPHPSNPNPATIFTTRIIRHNLQSHATCQWRVGPASRKPRMRSHDAAIVLIPREAAPATRERRRLSGDGSL